ncbi:MAG: hypothetical protein E6K63_11865 [Nitrospirae bacterium]|nr:MAG: hypothetical protein E6K63_11865 [Nitrospirota bacterium]
MSPRIALVVFLTGLFCILPAGAAKLGLPQVEYSADSVMQTEDMTMEKRVFYTPMKERHEGLGGATDAREAPVQIFRRDGKNVYGAEDREKRFERSLAVGL